jgi:WD40 repeat protein
MEKVTCSRPNSQKIAIPSSDKKISWIDINNEKQVSLQGNEISTRSVSFSHDGKKLAISDGAIIRLLNLEKNNLAVNGSLKGHKSTIIQATVSSDGQIIATASQDNTVKLWDRNGKLLRTLEGHGKAKPDETHFSEINTGNPALDANLNALNNRELTKYYERGFTWIRAVSFSPNSQILASGGSDLTVRIWQVNNGSQLHVLENGAGKGDINSVVFNPQGTRIASAGLGKEIKIWSIDGKLIHTIISSNIDLYKTSNNPLIKNLKGSLLGITSLRFSPDGQVLAAASIDKTIKLWDFNKIEKDANTNDSEIGTLSGHDREIYSIAFHPTLPLLVSGSADRTLKIWDYKSKTLLATLTGGHTGVILSVDFSVDGKTIISAGVDGRIIFWKFDSDTKSGVVIKTLYLENTRIYNIQITKDNLLVAVGNVPVDNKEFLPSGILLNLDANELVKRGCDLLGNYLKNNPNVRESDRQLCQ